MEFAQKCCQGILPAVLVLVPGYAWGQPTNLPSLPCSLFLLPYLADGPQGTHHMQEHPCSLDFLPLYVLLFIYPLPCLLSFCAAKDHWPSSLQTRPPSSVLSMHLVTLKGMKPPTSKTSVDRVPKPTPRAARLSQQNCRMLARLQPSELQRSSSMCVPLATWNCCPAWPLSPALFICSFT